MSSINQPRLSQPVRSPALSLLPASQPDLIRAIEKDQAYSQLLIESCQEAMRLLLGPFRALQLTSHSRLLALLIYHGLTTGCGAQTLGEEYVSMIQASNGGRAPSVIQRISLILMQALGPFVGEAVASRMDRESRLGEASTSSSRPTQVPQPSFSLSSHLQHVWIKLVEAWPGRILPALVFASKLHLALFYIYGEYYQLAKRLCGIKHITTSRPLQPHGTYRSLGWMLLAQLSISAALHASEPLQKMLLPKTRSGSSSVEGGGADASMPREGPAVMILHPEHDQDQELHQPSDPHLPPPQCPLCLSPRNHPTSTPCGHVFCWDCISRWCSAPSSSHQEGGISSGECPLCRSKVHPSQLVPLLHVDG